MIIRELTHQNGPKDIKKPRQVTLRGFRYKLKPVLHRHKIINCSTYRTLQGEYSFVNESLLPSSTQYNHQLRHQ